MYSDLPSRQIWTQVARSTPHPSVFDIKGENIDNLSTVFQNGLDRSLRNRISTFREYKPLMDSLGGANSPKLLVLSISHGSPADMVIERIREWLTHGDIILDGGNEWY